MAARRAATTPRWISLRPVARGCSTTSSPWRKRPLQAELAEAVDDVEGEPRHVVVELVVRQAAAIGDRPDREHRAAVRLLDIGHVGADELLERLAGDGGVETEPLLV